MSVADDAVSAARREVEKARVRFEEVCASAQLALDALEGQKRKPLAVGTARNVYHMACYGTKPGGGNEPGMFDGVRTDLSTFIPTGDYDVVIMVYERVKKNPSA